MASKGSTRSERYRDEEKDIHRKIEGKTRNENTTVASKLGWVSVLVRRIDIEAKPKRVDGPGAAPKIGEDRDPR